MPGRPPNTMHPVCLGEGDYAQDFSFSCMCALARSQLQSCTATLRNNYGLVLNDIGLKPVFSTYGSSLELLKLAGWDPNHCLSVFLYKEGSGLLLLLRCACSIHRRRF